MTTRNILLKDLYVSSENVRKDLAEFDNDDDTKIDDLVQSIIANGLLNPLTVCQDAENRYEIIAGQRRFLACSKIGLAEVQCNIVTASTPKDKKIISLVENTHRRKMTQAEKVRCYTEIYHYSNKDLTQTAKMVSLAPQTIQRYIEIGEKLSPSLIDRLDIEGEDKLTLEKSLSISKVPIEYQQFVANSIKEFRITSPKEISYLCKTAVSSAGQNPSKIMDIFREMCQDSVMKLAITTESGSYCSCSKNRITMKNGDVPIELSGEDLEAVRHFLTQRRNQT